LNLKINSKVEIDRNTINVYCCRYDRIDEPQLLNQYRRLLSEAEQQRWKNISSESAKRCFLLSRAMIRTLLGQAIGSPADALIISEDVQGKPFISQPATRWQFNLSHSHGQIVLALVYDTSVGIDVENYQRKTNLLQLARHFFHSEEIQQLENLPTDEQPTHFFKCWTLKEAYLKAIGVGLSYGLDRFSFTFQQENPRIVMNPLPDLALSCWSAKLEPNYLIAIIVLSECLEAKSLKLYDYIPYHSFSPKNADTLIHSVLASG